MLHDRHQLHVGESHVEGVFGELDGGVPVAQWLFPPFQAPSPGSEVYLVDRDRGIQTDAVPAMRHPFAIRPVVVQIPYPGSGSGGQLGEEGERVCLVYGVIVVTRDHVILVAIPFAQTRNEALPDSGFVMSDLHGVRDWAPFVEIACDRHALRVRRPDGEECTLLALHGHGSSPELLVEPKVIPLFEQVDVVLGDRACAVDDTAGVLHFLPHPGL